MSTEFFPSSPSGMRSTNESSLIDGLAAAALMGGRRINYHFRNKGFETGTKSSSADLVTSADREVQEMVIHFLSQLLPDVDIVAEETRNYDGAASVDRSTDQIYVDPIDGTMNFVHGYSEVAISIGYWRQGAPFAGVVFNPIRDELFTAVRGQGAYCNGEKISPSTTLSIADSLVGTGWPYEKIELDRAIATVRTLATNAREVRTIGCAALAVCYASAGIFDAFWEFRLAPWDLAGGIVIAQESGAAVLKPDGSPFDLKDGDVVVSNPNILQELTTLLATV